MEIEVSYFKQSGKYYMEEKILIPEKWINRFNEAWLNIKLLPDFQYDFRNWFEEEIRHDEFIAVVLTDYDLQPKQSKMLGFPMMIMPNK
ncbi:MAG: hypothetical protein RR494_02695 [Vagococcus sp.]|uniref:hypothetical protein n=1 Tax=Vagococcus sp. TaxID=1933889 RepID=UPI002FC8AD76